MRKKASGEQICRKHVVIRSPSKYIQWLKRYTNKAFRRLARQDPEDAPSKRRYRGWSD